MRVNDAEIRLETPSLRDRRRLSAIYREAFPPEERAPFWMLWMRRKRPYVDLFAIRRGAETVGMLYVVSDGTLSYVFYLAVDAACRGQGIGSGTLAAAIRHYAGRRLFLAIEPLDPSAPNAKERERRRAFYLRNGFEDLHRRVQEGPVVFDVLGVGGDVDADGYARLMERYMGKKAMQRFHIGMVEETSDK